MYNCSYISPGELKDELEDMGYDTNMMSYEDMVKVFYEILWGVI